MPQLNLTGTRSQSSFSDSEPRSSTHSNPRRPSLGNVPQLERLIGEAGFRDVRVTRETHQGIVGSFDEYWAPIEAGAGQMSQAYLALPEPSRRAVREELRARLTQFESEGRLVMSAEMLIGSGRA